MKRTTFGYKQMVTAEMLNERFADLAGGSILNGFRLAKGTGNYTISLRRGNDNPSAAITNDGVRLMETADVIDAVTIRPNTHVLTRYDVVYVAWRQELDEVTFDYFVVEGVPGLPVNIETNPANRLPLGYVRVRTNTSLAVDDLTSLDIGVKFGMLYANGMIINGTPILTKSYVDAEVQKNKDRIAATESEVSTARKTYVNLDERIRSELALKRDGLVPIKGADLETSTDADKIKVVNLSDEVLQRITGTTPVNATPGPGSVTNEKLADKSVTGAKIADNVVAFNHLDKIAYDMANSPTHKSVTSIRRLIADTLSLETVVSAYSNIKSYVKEPVQGLPFPSEAKVNQATVTVGSGGDGGITIPIPGRLFPKVEQLRIGDIVQFGCYVNLNTSTKFAYFGLVGWNMTNHHNDVLVKPVDCGNGWYWWSRDIVVDAAMIENDNGYYDQMLFKVAVNGFTEDKTFKIACPIAVVSKQRVNLLELINVYVQEEAKRLNELGRRAAVALSSKAVYSDMANLSNAIVERNATVTYGAAPTTINPSFKEVTVDVPSGNGGVAFLTGYFYKTNNVNPGDVLQIGLVTDLSSSDDFDYFGGVSWGQGLNTGTPRHLKVKNNMFLPIGNGYYFASCEYVLTADDIQNANAQLNSLLFRVAPSKPRKTFKINSVYAAITKSGLANETLIQRLQSQNRVDELARNVGEAATGTVLTYDAMNRVTQVVEKEGTNTILTTVITYDATGNVQNVTETRTNDVVSTSLTITNGLVTDITRAKTAR